MLLTLEEVNKQPLLRPVWLFVGMDKALRVRFRDIHLAISQPAQQPFHRITLLASLNRNSSLQVPQHQSRLQFLALPAHASVLLPHSCCPSGLASEWDCDLALRVNSAHLIT